MQGHTNFLLQTLNSFGDINLSVPPLLYFRHEERFFLSKKIQAHAGFVFVIYLLYINVR